MAKAGQTQALHYHAIAGMHGCMPNYGAHHTAYNDAVEDLAYVHELGRLRTRALREDGYLELNLHKDGNEYCEIVECQGPDCEPGVS